MKKTTKIEINIQHEDINLMGLISQVKGLEREIAKQVIYSVENELIEEMCGEEYERTRYQRLDSKPRTLKTSVGTLELDLKKVKDKETGEVFSPVERELNMPKGKTVLEDVSLESIEQIPKLSYRKAVKTSLLDNVGYYVMPPSDVTVMSSGVPVGSDNIYLSADWNLVSFPVVDENTSKESLFENSGVDPLLVTMLELSAGGSLTQVGLTESLLDNVGYYIIPPSAMTITCP